VDKKKNEQKTIRPSTSKRKEREIKWKCKAVTSKKIVKGDRKPLKEGNKQATNKGRVQQLSDQGTQPGEKRGDPKPCPMSRTKKRGSGSSKKKLRGDPVPSGGGRVKHNWFGVRGKQGRDPNKVKA